MIRVILRFIEKFSLLLNSTERQREKVSYATFRRAANEVPAYQSFLLEKGVDKSQISSWSHVLEQVPPINKDNYLRRHTKPDLSFKRGSDFQIFTSTSGSTGKPFYFSRTLALDRQYSFLIEDFISQSTRGAEGPILVINGFSMGVWIGGLITYNAFEIAAGRMDVAVSIINPGINKSLIIESLKELSGDFRQTILIGYPPFVKDVLDDAIDLGLDLEEKNLRFIFAAESFSDSFRKRVCDMGGVRNSSVDTMNIYGSADLGAMAGETPLSIAIRELTSENPSLFIRLFGQISKLPTLAQFNPAYINFDEIEGQLYVTGSNAMPLVKYQIGDEGGVIDFSAMMERLGDDNVALSEILTQHGIVEYDRNPFVYVYERTDMAISLYGLQIYPEHVKGALLSDDWHGYITGKFSMETMYDNEDNQYLEIRVECRGREVGEQMKGRILSRIVEVLSLNNSEYKELMKYLGSQAEPRLVFLEYENKKYFKPGIKQKWTI